ncbi:MAG: MerR family transcriptional regulator [Lachnoclostridium edouardi]|uniref:MerR family transcriptional regulator n=1 Tax=Lachnoclostridium edouardi TaxID=1926283 RepID=UPI0026DCFFF8|nr:MerR family transcriptional regulator [Lachnoclostridium edouardi]MDO4278967.1 MerR family transcriptional regulator [Lachnoclostridium edouardi]
MKELFTIGEIGRLFQMNIRTLRYYDQIGLLRPEKVDLKTGYRFYSTKQFERLNTIKYLRDLDVPIEKIIRFFENKDAENLMELLEEQREDIQLMKSRLDRIERKLERRITQLSDALSSKLYVIWEVNIPKRKIAFLRREIPMEEDLEYPIRELEQIRHLEPMMFLGKVGVSVAKENVVRQKLGHFSGIFVFLEQEDNYKGAEEYLQESLYVAIRYSGTHREAGESYRKLLQYMEEKQYECTGDSIEITLIDSGFTNDLEKYITEIQIPVKKKT